MDVYRMAADLRRASQLVRRQGVSALAARAARVAYRKLGADELDFPLLPADIADSARLVQTPPPNSPQPGTPLVIGWITTPPSLGSGGHTTMFRMVEALEAAGHRCVLYLYDRFGGDAAAHAAVVRQGWPTVKAEVRDLNDGLRGLDGVVATSWQTAHVLASRVNDGTRCLYFVQDFEPFFYPRGSEYALSEDSYRFGFRCIAIGHMVADLLRSEIGVDADVAEFGCDTDVYRLTNTGARSGVVFYTKPGVPRRAYRLGIAALAEFHRLCPEQEIHMFGDQVTDVSFPVTQHGRLTPADLNELYNVTVAGFAMSFTNISLVAEELLAAGTIPVINDAAYARADLVNPFACWARSTPGTLADALASVVTSEGQTTRAIAAAKSVRSGWRPAQECLVAAIENEIYG